MSRPIPTTERTADPEATTPDRTAKRPLDEIDANRLGRFLGTLVALTALFVAGSLVLGVDLLLLAPAYMFTPIIAGAVAVLPADVSRTAIGLTPGRLRWTAIGAVAVLPITAGIVALALAVPGVGLDASPDALADLGLPGGLLGIVVALFLAGITVNAAFAAGEEIGWRGYLLWELAPLGFWRGSAAVGAIWGLWHVPLIVAGHNFPSFPIVGSVLMLGFCIATAPLYTVMVVNGKSVLPAILLHGTFNAIAGNLVMSLTVVDSATVAELVAHPVGIAGIVVVGMVTLVIAVRGAPVLSRVSAAVDHAPSETGTSA